MTDVILHRQLPDVPFGLQSVSELILGADNVFWDSADPVRSFLDCVVRRHRCA